MKASDYVKTRTDFVKIVHKIPSTLHSTRAAAWLGLAVDSRKNIYSALLKH